MSIKEKIFLIIFLPLTIFLFVIIFEQVYEYTEYKKNEIKQKHQIVVHQEIKPELLIIKPERAK